MCVNRLEVWLFVYVCCYCNRFLYFWLFSASVDKTMTTLKTAVTLSCMSISRKGQSSISVIVKRSEAQVISPDPACPNQLAGRGSESHSFNVSRQDCRCLVWACKWQWLIGSIWGHFRTCPWENMARLAKSILGSVACCFMVAWLLIKSVSISWFLPEGFTHVTVLVMFLFKASAEVGSARLVHLLY